MSPHWGWQQQWGGKWLGWQVGQALLFFGKEADGAVLLAGKYLSYISFFWAFSSCSTLSSNNLFLNFRS
jgi:hypothetical protein